MVWFYSGGCFGVLVLVVVGLGWFGCVCCWVVVCLEVLSVDFFFCWVFVGILVGLDEGELFFE